jgi:predicted porin
MKLKFALIVTALFGFAGAAQAAELNYNYVEVGYSVIDIDDFNEDLDSISVGGSYLFTPDVYGFASYSDGETGSFMGGKIAVSGYEIGLGYRIGMAPATDLNFEAAFQRAKVEGKGAFSGSESENGYSIGVGVRHLVNPSIELLADVTYVDIEDDDTVLSVGGLWHITDVVAVGLGYSLASDFDGYTGTFRFKF